MVSNLRQALDKTRFKHPLSSKFFRLVSFGGKQTPHMSLYNMERCCRTCSWRQNSITFPNRTDQVHGEHRSLQTPQLQIANSENHRLGCCCPVLKQRDQMSNMLPWFINSSDTLVTSYRPKLHCRLTYRHIAWMRIMEWISPRSEVNLLTFRHTVEGIFIWGSIDIYRKLCVKEASASVRAGGKILEIYGGDVHLLVC